jgi:hypothetical protein
MCTCAAHADPPATHASHPMRDILPAFRAPQSGGRPHRESRSPPAAERPENAIRTWVLDCNRSGRVRSTISPSRNSRSRSGHHSPAIELVRAILSRTGSFRMLWWRVRAFKVLAGTLILVLRAILILYLPRSYWCDRTYYFSTPSCLDSKRVSPYTRTVIENNYKTI